MSSNFPIFVLTLHGDADRRQSLLDKLDAWETSYEVFYGVDGRNGLPEKYETLVDRDKTPEVAGRKLTDGEYACALSHREMYNRIVEENLDGAIILEDDALLTDGFPTFIKEKDYLRAPMILLDYAYGRALPFTKKNIESGSIHRCANQPTVTTAYSLSREVAAKLLQATTPVRAYADWPTCLYQLEARLIAPRLARHVDPKVDGNSHLFADRKALAQASLKPNIPGTKTFAARLRQRLSIRVGRARGQR